MSNMKTFSELLSEFKASQGKTRSLGVECAKLAYMCFKDTGNLTYSTHFWDALASNADKNGFKMWLEDFSPAMMVDGKFKKNRQKEDEEGEACWRVGAAWATSFYAHKQDKLETSTFEAGDLPTQVDRIIKRFQAANMTAENDGASAALASLVAHADLFRAEVDVIQEDVLKAADEAYAEATVEAVQAAQVELGDVPTGDVEEAPLQAVAAA
jgi:hypothetical protein